MSRPSKPANVIRMEDKSHRTKKELAERERAEAQLLTGKILKESPEVKKNEKAHEEFLRIKKLLKSIGKDDDLYGSAINRYCMLHAECFELEELKERIQKQIVLFEDAYDEYKGDKNLKAYFTMQDNMQKNLIAMDKQLQSKRKMMFDIEKENIMTIASSLRSVPKKPDTKKSALMEALTGGD